jgi:Na+/H+ antiporter NhaD/arsenite permease-like protein
MNTTFARLALILVLVCGHCSVSDADDNASTSDADVSGETTPSDDPRLEAVLESWGHVPETVRAELIRLVRDKLGDDPGSAGLADVWHELDEVEREHIYERTRVSHSPVVGGIMLVLLFTAFFAMTAYNVPLPLAMSLVACAFLALQPEYAEAILQSGFMHYANIVILFTAVAIPAHMIERSQGFSWVAAAIGYRFGRMQLTAPRMALPVLIIVLMVMTYVTAGLMHNVTSILIMTPIIIRLCDSYRLPSRWILCGALVASNLGGFSTKWGDTPNIIESATWKLTANDFWQEVLPANLIVLSGLTIVVIFLTRRTMLNRPASEMPHDSLSLRPDQADHTGFGKAIATAGWKEVARGLWIDKRLLLTGLILLAAFIVLHVVFDHWKIQIGAATILIAVLLERNAERDHTLKSLGFDVYLAFAAIFVLAGCIEHSWIGEYLRDQIVNTKAAPWAIAITGYFGTMFTEAASWATAASGQIYGLQGAPELVSAARSHSAAWALGGGICAGSSSLVTAASAGIILCEESSRFKNEAHTITFRKYLPFGLTCSLLMLVFYATYFTVFRF